MLSFNDYIFNFISNGSFSNPSVLFSFLAVSASRFFVLFIATMASFFSLGPIDILILQLFLVQ